MSEALCSIMPVEWDLEVTDAEWHATFKRANLWDETKWLQTLQTGIVEINSNEFTIESARFTVHASQLRMQCGESFKIWSKRVFGANSVEYRVKCIVNGISYSDFASNYEMIIFRYRGYNAVACTTLTEDARVSAGGSWLLIDVDKVVVHMVKNYCPYMLTRRMDRARTALIVPILSFSQAIFGVRDRHTIVNFMFGASLVLGPYVMFELVMRSGLFRHPWM